MPLRQRGAVEQAGVSHWDAYFNHPSRDFRTMNEAFRIRSVGNENGLTHKGPVIGTMAKSRHEIEMGFAAGPDSALQFAEMLKLLGFRIVREVRTSRSTWVLDSAGVTFELAIDHDVVWGHCGVGPLFRNLIVMHERCPHCSLK